MNEEDVIPESPLEKKMKRKNKEKIEVSENNKENEVKNN